MTSRTTDYHCPKCRQYLFSAYTYNLDKKELQKLDEEAKEHCADSKKTDER